LIFRCLFLQCRRELQPQEVYGGRNQRARSTEAGYGPSLPKNEQLLGAILYEKQDYAGAAQQMRNFLELTPSGPDADRVRTQLAEVEKLAGDTKATAEKPQQ